MSLERTWHKLAKAMNPKRTWHKMTMPRKHKRIFGYFNGEGLYRDMVKRFPSGSRFVEVGCFQGRSTCYMAQLIKRSRKSICFEVVDTFEGSDGLERMIAGQDLYGMFIQNMKQAGVLDLLQVRRLSSEEAAKTHDDESIDFVYLDASHDFDSVTRDIDAWLPRIKRGGILAGDDYHPSWQGVIDAVKSRFAEEDIEVIGGSQWVYRKK
jgi:hypothetical protein